MASKFPRNVPKAPDRLKNTTSTRMIASHSHADGNSRQMRRTQNARVVLMKSTDPRAVSSDGSKAAGDDEAGDREEQVDTGPETAKCVDSPLKLIAPREQDRRCVLDHHQDHGNRAQNPSISAIRPCCLAMPSVNQAADTCPQRGAFPAFSVSAVSAGIRRKFLSLLSTSSCEQKALRSRLALSDMRW